MLSGRSRNPVAVTAGDAASGELVLDAGDESAKLMLVDVCVSRSCRTERGWSVEYSRISAFHAD